ncbi:MAG: LOG family protein [Candidatus Kaiserbacteria bacterium]|nr:LOG family protein [Candidatus Kaiserbacteria bacterium]
MRNRKLQIGVMGSAQDLNYDDTLRDLAREIGREIAREGHVVVYGAEKDYDSLSTQAAKGAKEAGGLTVGVTYGKGKDIWENEGFTDIIIATGLERGGGREFVLVNSCDAIIAISGGSGTLTEIAIAYQSNIPVIVMNGTGGWAEKLGGTYIDKRNRVLAEEATTAQEAVSMAIRLTTNKQI